MAATGHSRIIEKRHWNDYASMKQYFKGHRFTEDIISGYVTTAGAAAEISFCSDTIDYIAAEGQIYIRCEADDANQHSKYVYVEYQDDTGAIATVVTGDLHATDSTTEVILTGADDFYRCRRMISEVESASGGGKAIVLTDADWGGANDTFAFIDDGNTQFAKERFFTQPNVTCRSFLGQIKVYGTIINEGDTTATGWILETTYTPRVITDFAEDQTAADLTMHHEFNEILDWQPCIELEGGTEVSFKLGDNGTPGELFIEATMLEVYL